MKFGILFLQSVEGKLKANPDLANTLCHYSGLRQDDPWWCCVEGWFGVVIAVLGFWFHFLALMTTLQSCTLGGQAQQPTPAWEVKVHCYVYSGRVLGDLVISQKWPLWPKCCPQPADQVQGEPQLKISCWTNPSSHRRHLWQVTILVITLILNWGRQKWAKMMWGHNKEVKYLDKSKGGRSTTTWRTNTEQIVTSWTCPARLPVVAF